MKFTLLLVLLAAVASQAGVVQDLKEDVNVERSASRANFQVGYLQAGDRLLYRQYLQRNRINNAVQYQDFNYRGAANTRINLIRATEVGPTQWGQVRILSGGLGRNNVTLRVQSYRGYGFHYMVELYGR